ncbi:uncharacterized protein LOC142181739 [Nicotiana tabacum]|uniref:Uncharacterized protein LOC142181739 n=1 Tax=Nicotiana tabacum TaxID=4097 RepID=A0AC58UPA8_TOBAC
MQKMMKFLGSESSSSFFQIDLLNDPVDEYKDNQFLTDSLEVCLARILMEENYKPIVQPQRRLNPAMQEVVKKEVVKVLAAGIIYPISDSPWIPIAPEYQEKNTFTCPHGTYAYRRIPFGLCNAPAPFQHCISAIFSYMTEKFLEIFMDDFTLFEGIVLGYKTTTKEIEVDKAKIDLIAVLPPPTTIKGTRSFLGHAGTKVTVFTEHVALKYLLTKKDARPRLLRWILLLQEFHLKIKYKKGLENQVADHLSRLENPPTELLDIQEEFPNEHIFSVMRLYRPPWFANIDNYLAGGNNKILSHCHDGAVGGYYGGRRTTTKVLEVGFFWPTLFEDARNFVIACDKCQRTGNISKRDEMPLNFILVCEIFDIWCIDFMDPFSPSNGCEYILVATRKNKASVVCDFLKKKYLF